MQREDKPLYGKVAVVTGASRGAGKGIAHELGAAGATVYVTGRSSRHHPNPAYDAVLSQYGLTRPPGTIEESAALVDEAGGVGIAVRCDHTDPEQVAALFDQVAREQGRCDLLVNNAWGAHETMQQVDRPFWEQPLADWHSMFDRGVLNHVIASQHAAPRMVAQGFGLILTTTFWDQGKYLKNNMFYDLAKATMNRLAFAMAEELRPHDVVSLGISPGFMRTELVLASAGVSEETFAQAPMLERSESPRYLGRAVVALARDPALLSRSGEVLRVGDLARFYQFTDVDGSQPPPFVL